jgi:PAS domain S-box-containing protein
MQSVRKLFGQTAAANCSIAPRVDMVRLEDAQPLTTPAPPTLAPGKHVGGSPTERRLKLIIESAPVSLVIIDAQGQTLAANRASLVLFGAARLEDVVAKNFDACVSPEDREAFIAFVTKVCQGELGSLRYEVVGFDGTRRRVETQAVPLRRDGSGAAFLGASWSAAEHRDAASPLGDVQSKYEQLCAERDALSETLAATKAMFRDAEERLRTSLADASHRHEELARRWSAEREALIGEWTGERESLVEKVRQAEERHAVITAQLSAEQHARQNAVAQARSEYEASLAEADEQRAALEGLRREHEAALAARGQEFTELKNSLSRAEKRYEALLAESRATCDDLRGTIRDLERRADGLVSERNAERATMENAVKAERARYEALLEEREKWLAELADVFAPLKDTSARVGRLLDAATAAQPAVADFWEDFAGEPEQPTEPSTDMSDVKLSEEDTWHL